MIEQLKLKLMRRLLKNPRAFIEAERYIALTHAADEISATLDETGLKPPPEVVADAIERLSYALNIETALTIEERSDMTYDALDEALPFGIDQAIEDAEAEHDWQEGERT